MNLRISTGRRAFVIFNYIFLALLSLLCMFPLIHMLALSFSSGGAAAAGKVTLWPVEFNTAAYRNIVNKPEYLTAFGISVQRLVLGTLISLMLTIITAYPLSKENTAFQFRTWYAWFFVFTILFSGGLIPWFMTIQKLGLMDTIWALVLPGALSVFNVILLLNFYRGLPKELDESARMDGAGHFRVLWSIIVPLSKPALATVGLFTMVAHWNSWFDGLVLMNRPEHYPLQSFLQTIVIQKDMRFISAENVELLKLISDRTSAAAQIFVASAPILIVYPFLQRFFIKGIVLGSVKE
ncbi:ABC transporter permease [Paenibacillus baekrokdamisoli]|uniref:ABC transporter permease n=1 Tax=Paenibacillus baekrokdamisoli TaxID=1712516 RepID=A0A3G9JCB5_9BACL|nr:carbohydrate ABC transporter permease [Paenibacillus baekrokdamisoli]MBB3071139.1 putative aldouronate transport system permease protein [Paenibacillus baekrokdamisoli]BBH21558.1 ABC transporter permease [Paenibacillus baekrokdamisoli]